MATSTFTSWADLYDALLDKLASGDFYLSKVTVGPQTYEFSCSTQRQLEQRLAWAKTQRDFELGTVVRRTYAKNGGRGR